MDKGQRLDAGIRFQCRFGLFQIDRQSKRIIDHDRRGPDADDVFAHTRAKYAVLADHDLVTRLDQIDEGGFHASRTGRRDGHSQGILRLECVAQQILQFVHHADKARIQMTDGRSRHRIEDTLRNRRRTGAEQEDFGWMKTVHGILCLIESTDESIASI